MQTILKLYFAVKEGCQENMKHIAVIPDSFGSVWTVTELK